MTAFTSLITDFLGVGLHSARPATPNVATGCTAMYYETDTSKLFAWDGSAWQLVTNVSPTFSGLGDVSLSGLANNDLLRYQTSDSKWHNATVNTVGALLTTLGTIGTGVWQATKVGLAYGGTNLDMTATGGTNKFLKQNSAGGAITVVTVAAADLSDGTTGTGSIVMSASPALTGNPTAPTQSALNNSTRLATTAYVDAAVTAGAGAGTVTHTGGGLTAHAPIVGAGSADEKALAAMTDGQLMIGSTGNDPALAGLTAGSGITITPAAGSITIAASGTGVPSIADGDLLTNQSGGSATPTDHTLTSYLDYVFGSTTGNTPYRDSTKWESWNNPWAGPCNVVATSALAANTYANGSSGVGATLTGNSNGALAAIDGQTPSAGWRILVAGEATQANNGLYDVTTLGDGSHPYVLTRCLDANNAAQLNFKTVGIELGTTYNSSIWIMTASGAITVGSTALIPQLIASPSGAGLSLPNVASGNILGNSGGSTAQATSVTLAAIMNRVSGDATKFWQGDGNLGTGSGISGLAPGAGSGLFGTSMSAVPTASGTGLSTWVNQGSATVADTTSGIYLKVDSGHGGGWAARKTSSAGTHKWSALVAMPSLLATHFVGIGFTDGTKIHNIYAIYSGGVISIQVAKWTNSTTFSATDVTRAGMVGGYWWFQIEDDGTNAVFRIGNDGVNWTDLYSVAKASGYLGSGGYSAVLFGGGIQSSGVENGCSLLSWTKV